MVCKNCSHPIGCFFFLLVICYTEDFEFMYSYLFILLLLPVLWVSIPKNIIAKTSVKAPFPYFPSVFG